MSQAINRIFLVGRLGADPELRRTQSGQAVMRCRLATTSQWRDKDGTVQERTDWHTVVLWGKRGEALARLLGKGERIGVEGRLRSRQWQTPEGERRTSVEVEATDVVLLGEGRRRRSEGDGAEAADPLPF